MRGWLRPKDVCEYAGVGERTVWAWFKNGLPHSKIGGVTLVRREEVDRYLASFQVQENQVNKVVDEVMSSFGRR